MMARDLIGDLDMLAWKAGAVDRYHDGVALIPLVVELNPLSRGCIPAAPMEPAGKPMSRAA